MIAASRGARLTALARVALYRDADNDCARELAGGRWTWSRSPTTWAASTRWRCSATSCWWEGDLEEVERLATERLAIAERIGRSDLQSGVLLELNDVYNARLEPERAQEPLARAIELARRERKPGDAWLDAAGDRPAGALEGRLDEAEAAARRRRARCSPRAGPLSRMARTLNWLGIVVWERRRPSTCGERSSAMRSAS